MGPQGSSCRGLGGGPPGPSWGGATGKGGAERERERWRERMGRAESVFPVQAAAETLRGNLLPQGG